MCVVPLLCYVYRVWIPLVSYFSLSLMILCVCVCVCVRADKREFCQFDSFEAHCGENDAIIIESAHYGRMRSGRCISGEGYIGCSADVRTFMDGHCSGRRHCVVTVASLTSIVQPCRRDFTSYLEATFTCKKGEIKLLISYVLSVVLLIQYSQLVYSFI